MGRYEERRLVIPQAQESGMPVTSQSAESTAANRRCFLSGHGKITLSARAIELLTDEDRFSFITSAGKRQLASLPSSKQSVRDQMGHPFPLRL
jgi:hypothetical protein